jgi:hypothetical protein
MGMGGGGLAESNQRVPSTNLSGIETQDVVNIAVWAYNII